MQHKNAKNNKTPSLTNQLFRLAYHHRAGEYLVQHELLFLLPFDAHVLDCVVDELLVATDGIFFLFALHII